MRRLGVVFLMIFAFLAAITVLKAQTAPPVKPDPKVQTQPQKPASPPVAIQGRGMGQGMGMGPGPGGGRGQTGVKPGMRGVGAGGRGPMSGSTIQPCSIVLSQNSHLVGVPEFLGPNRWRVVIRERKGSELSTSVNLLMCRPSSPLLTQEVVIRENVGLNIGMMQGRGQQDPLRQQMRRGLRMGVDIGNAPVRIGGEISPPIKTKDVRPVYPTQAQKDRIQGVVILEITIDRLGKVTNAVVLRSIPMLDQAAIDAVKQWEFTPTTINGVSVPVLMTVTVNFTLVG